MLCAWFGGWMIGCASPSPTPPSIALATIKGRALAAEDSRPLDNVDIALFAGARRIKFTRSLPNGSYVIPSIPVGTYVLIATHQDQRLRSRPVTIKADQTWHVDLPFSLGVAEAEIRFDEEPASNVVASPRPHPRGLGHVTGYVGTRGTKLRRRDVVLYLTHAGSEPLITVTDADGRFEFSDVPSGRYRLASYFTVSGKGFVEHVREVFVQGNTQVEVPLLLFAPW